MWLVVDTTYIISRDMAFWLRYKMDGFVIQYRFMGHIQEIKVVFDARHVTPWIFHVEIWGYVEKPWSQI